MYSLKHKKTKLHNFKNIDPTNFLLIKIGIGVWVMELHKRYW